MDEENKLMIKYNDILNRMDFNDKIENAAQKYDIWETENLDVLFTITLILLDQDKK